MRPRPGLIAERSGLSSGMEAARRNGSAFKTVLDFEPQSPHLPQPCRLQRFSPTLGFRPGSGSGRSTISARGKRRTDRTARHGYPGIAGHDVSGGPRQRARGSGPYFRQDAEKLHPDKCGRQGGGRNHALRPEQSSNHVSSRLTALRFRRRARASFQSGTRISNRGIRVTTFLPRASTPR